MYDQIINTQHRTAFVIAVDCSTSMQEHICFNSLSMSKAEAVSVICNYIIDELVARATRCGEVRNYYDIAVIGYSGDGVVSMLPTHNNLVAVNVLAEMQPKPQEFHFRQIVDRDTVTSVSMTLHPWIKPTATGLTPMYEALSLVDAMVGEWCSREAHRNSFPPIVFNITDGECSDGNASDLIAVAKSIMSHTTSDGNVLMMNVHLSTDANVPSIVLPSNDNFGIVSPYHDMLFHMSSILPQRMEPLVAELMHPNRSMPLRCVAFNASINELLMILNIGSQSVSNL